MPKSNVTAGRVAEICARLINNESQTSIQRHTKVGSYTIGRIVAALREHGVPLETIARGTLDNVRKAELHKMFSTTLMSNRQITLALKIKLDTVNRHRKLFNAAELRAGRELPKCDCGQYLHHPRLCWARNHQQMKARGMRSIVTLGAEQQEDVRRRLLRGETLRSIAALVSVPKYGVRNFLARLSIEERRERQDCFLVTAARRRAAKMARELSRPKATNPNIDPLYAQIAKAVPRGIDPALRDDMISQAYLEVLEGKLDTSRLAEGVRKIRGRVFKAFANPWGAASLNALASDGSGRSMINNIPDGATAFV